MDRCLWLDVLALVKTEVAMTRRFFAACNGRDCRSLIIRTTTWLARQHSTIFEERFRLSPIKNRAAISVWFRPQRQKNTRIVPDRRDSRTLVQSASPCPARQIHRISAAPALIISYEEQRFGVTHKIRSIALKPYVHVLTLTATLIPHIADAD